MAIATYNDLAAAVKSWCARSDSTFSNQIETMVAQHELRMYNGAGVPGDPMYCAALEVPELEVIASITLTNGVGTIPADATGIRTLTRPGDKVGLDYFTPRQYEILAARYPSGTTLGFTIKGNKIYAVPPTAGDVVYTALYFQELAPISQSVQTNLLLTTYPLVYFNGTMLEAFTFIQAADKAALWLQKYKTALDGINTSYSSIRRSGVPMRVRQRNAIP